MNILLKIAQVVLFAVAVLLAFFTIKIFIEYFGVKYFLIGSFVTVWLISMVGGMEGFQKWRQEKQKEEYKPEINVPVVGNFMKCTCNGCKKHRANILAGGPLYNSGAPTPTYGMEKIRQQIVDMGE